MSPYEVLGVRSNASDQEIKSAYRRLVKQYHPDRNKASDAHERIAMINEAYDILSDSQKRVQFDNRFQTFWSHGEVQTQEDPAEAYKRDFKRKRREQERIEREKELENRKLLFKIARYFSYPLLLFATYRFFDGLRPTSSTDPPSLMLIGLMVTSSIVIYKKEYSEERYAVVYLPFAFFILTLLWS